MTNQTNETTPYTEPYTETQAINLTIQYGFDGSEFNDKTFQQRGCLRTDNTYKKLLRKLQSIADVEVTGRGKKRTYYLSNFRKEEEIEERYSQSDKRGGREPTLTHKLIYYHIFLLLRQNEGEELTKSQLQRLISPYNAPKIFNENNSEFRNAVCYISGITNDDMYYIPKSNSFKKQFQSYLVTIIKTALKQLERRGHISKETKTYARVYAKEKTIYKTISRDYYEELSASFDEAIKKTMGTNKNKLDYFHIFFKDDPTEDEIRQVKEIKDMSNNEGFDYVFKKYTYKIHSTKDDVLDDILSITRHNGERVYSKDEVKDIIASDYNMSFDFITANSMIPRFRLFNRKIIEYVESDKRSENYLLKKEIISFTHYYIKSNYIYNFERLRSPNDEYDDKHDEVKNKSNLLFSHHFINGSNIYKKDYVHPSIELLKVIKINLKDDSNLREVNDMFYNYFDELIEFNDLNI